MSDDDTPFDKAPRRRAPTIADVAATADVAIGTVSRFLNGHEIRRANREAIEAAIEKLSYRRNAVAAAMKTDLTHMIGLLIPAFDDYHAVMVERLAVTIRSTGRALVMYCHSGDRRIMGEALDFFAAQRVDGLIMDGVPEVRGRVERLLADGIPIVLYNNDMPGVAADRVLVENRRDSLRAVGHLLDLRHERVAILVGDFRDSSARQRLEGYEAALAAHGIPLDPDYVVGADWSPDKGYQATKQLMELPRPPTAIFASNYGMAVGALGWLKDNGRRVPDDLSLVSFDDVALFRLHEAGITAVSQPLHRIADGITDLLVSRLGEAKHRVPRAIVLDCDIILRGSTRRLRVPA